MLFQNSYIGFNNNWIMPWNYFCAVSFANHFPRWLYFLNSCEHSARHLSFLPKKNLPARRSYSPREAFVRSSSLHRNSFSCTPWMKNVFRLLCQKNDQFSKNYLRQNEKELINRMKIKKQRITVLGLWCGDFLISESEKQTDGERKNTRQS